MSWVEILGFATGVVCVWLTAIQNIWCWPVGLANNAFFLALLVKDRLYADCLLQVVYVALGVSGWWHWLHGGRGRDVLPVSRTPRRAWPVLGVAFAAAGAGLALLLSRGAGWLGVPPPDRIWWDASTTAACLVAQYMLTRKWLENWVVWIATNVSFIGLYVVKERLLIAVLQVVFIAISVQGYRSWRADLERRERTPESAGAGGWTPEAVAAEEECGE